MYLSVFLIKILIIYLLNIIIIIFCVIVLDFAYYFLHQND